MQYEQQYPPGFDKAGRVLVLDTMTINHQAVSYSLMAGKVNYLNNLSELDTWIKVLLLGKS